jgi:arabinose-5-phosphate isomerase
VRDAFAAPAPAGRRSGAILLVDDEGVLEGLFTDSDLARLLEHRRHDALDQPIRGVMTRDPFTITIDSTLADVIETLSEMKISELPVVDRQRRPVGLVDITDVIGWSPVARAG